MCNLLIYWIHIWWRHVLPRQLQAIFLKKLIPQGYLSNWDFRILIKKWSTYLFFTHYIFLISRYLCMKIIKSRKENKHLKTLLVSLKTMPFQYLRTYYWHCFCGQPCKKNYCQPAYFWHLQLIRAFIQWCFWSHYVSCCCQRYKIRLNGTAGVKEELKLTCGVACIIVHRKLILVHM